MNKRELLEALKEKENIGAEQGIICSSYNAG